ncbi:hypothetical protein SAMN06265377_0919 [Flagellimonas pacifica]|uniref:FeoB-associated Cys-rich membrane protein n=1 Tax=Flagellimonas pacifica TaxID=1247520 RepID=A0A285MEV5_9FLAO|nr:hypothetical protein SAMN06265377_0919 [Allomuricauda parva]
MEILQHILMYSTLVIAVCYLVWKFILPKSLLRGKKNTPNACGQDGCGCD